MEYKIFGGGLINLVFAEYLHRNGKKFSWHTLGEKVGGHFSGLMLDNQAVDLGMVLLEFGLERFDKLDDARDINTSRSLLSYFSGYDTEPALVKCKVQSNLFPDYIISDDCSLIWDRNYPANLLMKSPDRKWQSAYFDQITYDEYCRKSYDVFYHELLEKFASKISSDGHKKISARYHRSAWLPLYYPDTIAGKNRKIKPYPFRKFSGRSVAEVVNEKFNLLRSREGILINQNQMKLDDLLAKEDRSKVFISCDLKKYGDQYIEMLSECTFQTKINIAVYSSPKNANLGVDCINDIDDNEIYRISFQTPSNQNCYIVVEGVGTFPEDDGWLSRSRQYLVNNFQLDDVELKFSKCYFNGPKLPLPGAELTLNLIRSQILGKFKNANFYNYGIQDGFQALSMNRQISHALNNWAKLI